MPQIINIYQAKTQLSKLIDQVLAGGEVTIGRAGRPVAKLVSYREKPLKRQFGLLKGKIFVPDDFDDESEEINEMFYGSGKL